METQENSSWFKFRDKMKDGDRECDIILQQKDYFWLSLDIHMVDGANICSLCEVTFIKELTGSLGRDFC